jgi:acyl-CoA thioester hydrolase
MASFQGADMIENTTEVRVRYAETDAMGVAYHANYLVWFEVGRTALLEELGYPYAQLEADGIILPVVECHVRYRVPARYDEVLLVRSRCTELRGVSMVLSYRIENKATGTLLAEGWTKHAIVDRNMKPVKVRDVNPRLLELLQG